MTTPLLPLRLDGVRRREAQRRAAEWLTRLEIDDVAGKRPGEVSGGQGQRVAVARALVTGARAVFGAGSLSWQLAVRRLQLSGGSSVRAVNAIAVAAAGTIALQMLFSATEAEYTKPTHQDLNRAQAVAVVTDSALGPVRGPADVDAGLRADRAVTGVSTFWRGSAFDGGHEYETVVGDCAALRELADLPDCAEGDAFLLDVPALAGRTVRLGMGSDAPQWTLPATARPAGPWPRGPTRTGGSTGGCCSRRRWPRQRRARPPTCRMCASTAPTPTPRSGCATRPAGSVPSWA